MLRLYYNPNCSKSRAALARMQAAGLAPQVINYLTDPPQRQQLQALIDKLDEPAAKLLRDHADTEVVDAAEVVTRLLAAPELMQRPVVELETRAIIARPPERIDAFLSIAPNPT